jgi:alginate O-acetyltransferase complex protein AlgI
VRLPNNFFRPYAAGSIVEFWRRWHVTLSYWLRDYIYIPLGGNRHGRFRQAVNVVVTMAIGGLWHGANWTFVIWGFLHGIGVAVGHGMRLVTRSIPGWLAVLITFHFVTIGWVFFRAPSIHVALAMLHDAVSGFGWSDATTVVSANVFVVVLLALFFGLHRFDDHREVKAAVRSLRPDVLWPVIVTLWVIAITISQGSSAKFIYFDF